MQLISVLRWLLGKASKKGEKFTKGKPAKRKVYERKNARVFIKMKIIIDTEDDERKDDETKDTMTNRIAASMICLEAGAEIVDDTGERIAGPHKKYPMIAVPPTTKKGVGFSVHYKPSVGILFYSATHDFDLKKFVTRVSDRMHSIGDSHLNTSRAISAAPCAILRKTEVIASRQCVEIVSSIDDVKRILTKRKPALERKRRTGRRRAHSPVDAAPETQKYTRKIIVLPPTFQHYLPMFSNTHGSVFTWFVMNGSAALSLLSKSPGRHINCVNAMIASVFADFGKVFDIRQCMETMKIPPLRRKYYQRPDPWEKGDQKGEKKDGRKDDEIPLLIKTVSKEAILVNIDSEEMTVVGSRNNFIKIQTENKLPAARRGDWKDLDVVSDEKNGIHRCFLCDIPLWGNVFVVHGAKPTEVMDPIIGQRGIAVCKFCNDNLVRASGLKYTLYKVKLPQTQIQALEASEYRDYVPILKIATETKQQNCAIIDPVPGLPGVYIISGKIVLATEETLPEFMELGIPSIVDLPIVRVGAIAEAP